MCILPPCIMYTLCATATHRGQRSVEDTGSPKVRGL